MPRDGTLVDLLEELQKKLNLEQDDVRNLRIFEAHSGKFYKEHELDSKIAGVNDFVPLYAEKIPEDEINMEEDERTISAFSFDREPSKPHGVPFTFVMKPVSGIGANCQNLCLLMVVQQGEVFRETKERISRRTGIKGKQFEKIKFAVVPRTLYSSSPRYLEDGKF